MKKSKLYYLLSLIFIILTSIGGMLYRNYIYSNNIYDYGFADMHTNIGAVLVASFLFMGYSKYDSYYKELKIITGCTIGFIIYEFIQLTPFIGIFDIKDIIATLLGGLITYLIHKIINKKSII